MPTAVPTTIINYIAPPAAEATPNATGLRLKEDAAGRKWLQNRDYNIYVHDGGRVDVVSREKDADRHPVMTLRYDGRGQLKMNGVRVAETDGRISISLPGSDRSGGENTVLTIDPDQLDGSPTGYANRVSVTAGSAGYSVNGAGKGMLGDLRLDAITNRDGATLEANLAAGSVQIMVDPTRQQLLVGTASQGIVALNQQRFNEARQANPTVAFGAVAVGGTGEAPRVGRQPTLGMKGDDLVFDNGNYTAVIDKQRGSMKVHNKATGEKYEVWGDPHLSFDDQKMDLHHNTLFTLDDGTTIVAEMEKGNANPHIDRLTVVDGQGNFGAVIDHVSPNDPKALKVSEMRPDGGRELLQNLPVRLSLDEYEFGGGFLTRDKAGKQVLVNQEVINEIEQGEDQRLRVAPSGDLPWQRPASAPAVAFSQPTWSAAPQQGMNALLGQMLQAMLLHMQTSSMGLGAFGMMGKGGSLLAQAYPFGQNS